MKQKPKSCMCSLCRSVKSGEAPGQKQRQREERSFRRRQHVAEWMALRDEDHEFSAAPFGDYHA